MTIYFVLKQYINLLYLYCVIIQVSNVLVKKSRRVSFTVLLKKICQYQINCIILSKTVQCNVTKYYGPTSWRMVKDDIELP